MNRIKHALVDIAVTIVIIVAVTTDWTWARWAVIVYTPVMLALKLFAVLGAASIGRLKVEGPPKGLIHMLYAVNVIALGLAAWWYLFAGWLVIWSLSIIQDRRLR